MTTNFVLKGAQLIQEAVQKDDAAEYHEALSLYTEGIQYLMTGMKYQQNEAVINAVKAKVRKYLSRAEELRKQLNSDIKLATTEKEVAPSCPVDLSKSAQVLVQAFCSQYEKLSQRTVIPSEIVTVLFRFYFISAIDFIAQPAVQWTDVIGMDDLKSSMRARIVIPLRFPHLLPVRRVPYGCRLLFGPKGCGKKYLVEACAAESKCSLLVVHCEDLVLQCNDNRAVSQAIKFSFQMAHRQKPCILCFDGVHALDMKIRKCAKFELHAQMDKLYRARRKLDSVDVEVVATSEQPWTLIIKKLFCSRNYVAAPDAESRQKLIRRYTEMLWTTFTLSDSDYALLSAKMNGFTCDEIVNLILDLWKRKQQSVCTVETFMEAIHARGLHPRISRDELEQHVRFQRMHGTA